MPTLVGLDDIRLLRQFSTVACITPVISLALVDLVLAGSLLEKVPHPKMTFVLALERRLTNK